MPHTVPTPGFPIGTPVEQAVRRCCGCGAWMIGYRTCTSCRTVNVPEQREETAA